MYMKKDELLFFEEEMEWRKSISQRDFGKELLETLSYREASDFLTPLLETRIDAKKAFEKKYKKIVRDIRKKYAPDTFEFDFVVDMVWAITYSNSDLKNESQLKELERYWLFNEARRPRRSGVKQMPRWDFNLAIEKAKSVPIESMLTDSVKKSGVNTLVSLCPFHEERTPSFTIYVTSNTYHCFGCEAHGDVIDFYQNLYGVSFVEAVKNLSNL